MTTKRKVEVFSAGCPACNDTVALVQSFACPSCDIRPVAGRIPRAKRAGQAPPPPPSLPGGRKIRLEASRIAQNGRQYVRLNWSGARGKEVDIYQNGKFRRFTVNDGRGSVWPKKRGTYEYRLCERGSSRCSNTATVTLR
jgi:hypothetical protein